MYWNSLRDFQREVSLWRSAHEIDITEGAYVWTRTHSPCYIYLTRIGSGYPNLLHILRTWPDFIRLLIKQVSFVHFGCICSDSGSLGQLLINHCLRWALWTGASYPPDIVGTFVIPVCLFLPYNTTPFYYLTSFYLGWTCLSSASGGLPLPSRVSHPRKPVSVFWIPRLLSSETRQIRS